MHHFIAMSSLGHVAFHSESPENKNDKSTVIIEPLQQESELTLIKSSRI